MSGLQNDFPTGWVSTRLGELYNFEYGKSLTKGSRAEAGIYPVYGSSGIVGTHDQFLIEGPAIIVGRKGAAGSVHYSTDNSWPIDTTYYVRGDKNLCLKFSYYLFRSLNLAKLEASTAIPGLNRNHAYDETVLLPPFPEQHRIVAKIEELFSELDKGIENLKTARAQLKVYRQALLKYAFAGKGLVQKRIIAQPFGEECIFTLGDVIQTLGQGWSPRCLETPSQGDDVWGVIRTTAIQPLHFDDTKNKQLPVGLEPKPRLEIIPGDVLITRAGPRTRVGIACFVKNTRPKLMVCDKAYRLQVDKEKILPQYLVMLLNTSEVLNELERLKSGISDSGLNLTQDKFLMLKIRVPTLEHQQIILDDIEAKLSEVDQLDQTITTSLQQAEALRQSILKKSFSGQLVPQDQHDEPASALLARIKAEKFAQSHSKKVRA